MGNKLIYVLNSYSKNSSEHYYHSINLCKELIKQGVEITILVENYSDQHITNIEGIPFQYLNSNNLILKYLELGRRLWILHNNGFGKVFVRVSQKAALVAVVLAFVTRLEIYYWQSGTTHEIKKRISLREYLTSVLPFKIIKNRVYRFVTGPKSMVKYYESKVGVKKHKLAELHNDVDISRYSVSKIEKQNLRYTKGIAEDVLVILFVHRFSPVRKTLDYIPEAFQDLSNDKVKIVVIGGGPDLDKFISKTRDLITKPEILILGEVPSREVDNWFKIADVFINPSYTEGFPRVLLEAMASKCAIVTTNAGGTIDIISQAQRNFMVDRNQPKHFKEKLEYLISQRDLIHDLAESNYHWVVRRYSTPIVAKMYQNVIFGEKK